MPDKLNATIHIGGPKCGSSSIQHHLSMRPAFTSDDGQISYRYIAIDKYGNVFQDRDLTNRATMSPLGYISSVGFGRGTINIEKFLSSTETVRRLIQDGHHLILSAEGWCRSAHIFEQHGLLERLGLNAKVVLFIRPPLDWLNAAWWQWGAWSGHSFERWSRHAVRNTFWEQPILNWQNIAGVDSVEVRVIESDVVTSFGEILGCKWQPTARYNQKSPGTLLRYLQEHRDFRPGQHSPEIEFVLNRWLHIPGARTPWIIPANKQDEIMAQFTPHMKRLMQLVSPGTRESMRKDGRWWSSEPYKDIDVEADIAELSNDERDELIRALIQGIQKADAENRKLKLSQRQ